MKLLETVTKVHGFQNSASLKFCWCGPDAFVCASLTDEGQMAIVPINGEMHETVCQGSYTQDPSQPGKLVDIVGEVDGARIITETTHEW